MVNILNKKFTLSGLELKALGMASQHYNMILDGTLKHSLAENAYNSFREFYLPVLKKVQEIDYFREILENFEEKIKEKYKIST